MRIFIVAVALVCCISSSFAQKKPNLENGIALQGYDAVSYFKLKPSKGFKSLSYPYNEAIYYFTTGANREEFKKSPEKFVPQYGGWCAYAMGLDGSLVEVDPMTFKIIDSKLYLFYNAYFNNTKEKWDKDEGRLKKSADRNWN